MRTNRACERTRRSIERTYACCWVRHCHASSHVHAAPCHAHAYARSIYAASQPAASIRLRSGRPARLRHRRLPARWRLSVVGRPVRFRSVARMRAARLAPPRRPAVARGCPGLVPCFSRPRHHTNPRIAFTDRPAGARAVARPVNIMEASLLGEMFRFCLLSSIYDFMTVC